MESRLPRFYPINHHLKGSLPVPNPSRCHISPPFESYNSRQLLRRDSGLSVAEFSKRQDVAMQQYQESRERADSKIPVYRTLAKSLSLLHGDQQIQFNELQTVHESRQDPINSVKLESVTHSKPRSSFPIGRSSIERSCQGSAGHFLPEEMLKAAERKNNETETQKAEWSGKNKMFASNRVLELKHKFEAFGRKQSKTKLLRRNVRNRYMESSNLKDELNLQNTNSSSPNIDIGIFSKPLANEIARALKKPDLADLSCQQLSISNSSSHRRWTSGYPRPALSLSTQRPLTAKQNNTTLFSQECLDEGFKSCKNLHKNLHERLVVIQETTHEQLPSVNNDASTHKHFLENENDKISIDSGSEKSCSISLHRANSKREEMVANSSERQVTAICRNRQASEKLDQPRVMDGVINPVGRVHSEPLTPSSLIKTIRAESPRRKIFETKSDKMISQTANSGHICEKEKGCDRDRALNKQRNKCRAEVHRSLTDHRSEGTREASKNKNVSHRITTSNHSLESCQHHLQNNESGHCINANSRKEQDDVVGENSQLSGVLEDNEAIQVPTDTQFDNTDEQKQPDVTESISLMSSPIHNGRLLPILPLPSSSINGFEANADSLHSLADLAHCRDYSVIMDHYCPGPDCSCYRTQLTRQTAYSSDDDFYLSCNHARKIQTRGIASDSSSELFPLGINKSVVRKKTRKKKFHESPVDSSLHCVQPRHFSPFPSLIQSHTDQMKTTCEFSERNLNTTGVATDSSQRLLCCKKTSKEALVEQMAQTIRSDSSLLQGPSKASLKALWHDSSTPFKHHSPNQAAAQSCTNILEKDQQIDVMLMAVNDEMSTDKLEVINNLESNRNSHQSQIGRNKKWMSSTEFVDLLEDDGKSTVEPAKNSVVSVKPVSGMISMYRTHGPIKANFSERAKSVDLIDFKTSLLLPMNTSSQKRDLFQSQTVVLETNKPIMNQAKDSSSKPRTKLAADKCDELVRKCDARCLTVFRHQPIHRWANTRHKQQISPYLHTSCSTDSITTDCEFNTRYLHPQIQHSRYALRRRQHSNIGFKVINTAATAPKDDSASNVGSSANFKTILRQLRQHSAEEQEKGVETSSVEEMVKGYNHPLLLSESEPEVDSNDDRNIDVDILTLPGNKRKEHTELIEHERTEITKQVFDQNRLLFEGMHILQFRQQVCLLFIGIIFILIFYIKFFHIIQSAIF